MLGALASAVARFSARQALVAPACFFLAPICGRKLRGKHQLASEHPAFSVGSTVGDLTFVAQDAAGAGGLPSGTVPQAERTLTPTTRLADWVGARHLQSASHRIDLRALAGAGCARCRRRHCLRCRACDGAWLRGGAAQHGGVEGA
jgi:hypothetical protein